MSTEINPYRLIAPVYWDMYDDMLAGGHLEYWTKGGRGSGKSSNISVEILMGMLLDPLANAIIYRQVANTIKDSVYAQMLWAVAELGLSGYEQTHPMALSGGQKQRVAICSALAADAALLLFDEPTSGLDHKHMTTVAALLKSLAERGKTVIVSTHDPELIALCCDYILCIEKGRVRYLRKV